jgi:hypothetical protein
MSMDNTFYSSGEDYFYPHYLFNIGNHIIIGIMIDSDDDTFHVGIRKYRHSYEYDWVNAPKPPNSFELAALRQTLGNMLDYGVEIHGKNAMLAETCDRLFDMSVIKSARRE